MNALLSSGTFQAFLTVKREYPYHRWEPIYIGTKYDPYYSEKLTWEGQQDKMTQVVLKFSERLITYCTPFSDARNVPYGIQICDFGWGIFGSLAWN